MESFHWGEPGLGVVVVSDIGGGFKVLDGYDVYISDV